MDLRDKFIEFCKENTEGSPEFTKVDDDKIKILTWKEKEEDLEYIVYMAFHEDDTIVEISLSRLYEIDYSSESLLGVYSALNEFSSKFITASCFYDDKSSLVTLQTFMVPCGNLDKDAENLFVSLRAAYICAIETILAL